jgi:hypothetical protein
LKVPLYRAPPTRLSRTAPGRPSGGEQLQNALTSRIAIEQAKGVLAERNGLSLDAAFDALRRHARDHNLKLTAVANGGRERTARPDRSLIADTWLVDGTDRQHLVGLRALRRGFR